jgi:hypothetical protein
MPDEYPDTCLKGIPNETYIIGNSVSFTAFMPPSGQAVNGWRESSINWELDELAIAELLNRHKNGEVHFKAGAVKIPRSELDEIIELFQVRDKFRYERKPDNDNRYHGNLLFIETMEKELRTTICGALSRSVTDFVRREGE